MAIQEETISEKSFEADHSACDEAMQTYHRKLAQLVTRHLPDGWDWVAPEMYASQNNLVDIKREFERTTRLASGRE